MYTVIDRWLQGGSNERPTSADPVGIAAVNEFIGTPGETAFRGILSSTKPSYQGRNVKISIRIMLALDFTVGLA